MLPQKPQEIVQTANIAQLTKVSKVHSHSTPEEKIALFRSLFRGRDDVYAKRWYSSKSEKSGYRPVCGNEWDDMLCNKHKYKCNICPGRKLLSLDDKAVYEHLKGADKNGKDVIGIYPMLADETCLFLAVDFDDDGFETDVTAFRNACIENDVPVYIERSRSGNGAHAWFFFDENISAYTARRLGSGLLTYAMNKRSEIKFNSYDRLFPNQDTMPSGGFGNLIALPLQGQARKNNKSVFVDENFMPYGDQWAYLSSVKKMIASEVEQLVSILCKNTDLGTLVKDIEETDKPWESVKPQTAIAVNDFPCFGLEITKSNMLYMEKDGISQSALNRIKRLTAFKNPEFYKAQAMRLPTFNKPRIISTVDETEKYISIPRGAETALLTMLDEINVVYTIDDKTNCDTKIKVSFNGTLRDEQTLAANAMLRHKNGVLSATTAFGKTVIGAKIIAEHKVNTLVLVHTGALLTQWKKSLSEFLILDHDLPEMPGKRGRKKEQHIIGQLGAGKNTLSGIVDIAVMQSLVSGDDVKELVRNYGQIIVDECHHVSAVNFEKILKYATAKYVYGLTATPTRQDGHHPIIFLQCGDIRYRVDAKAQAEKRPFEHFIVPRFTSFKKISLKDENKIAQIYNDLAINELRNRHIITDIVSALENGRNPIILTERSEHVTALAKMLEGKCENIITLVGSMSVKKKRAANERLYSLPTDTNFIIIATGKYVGEGFDFPRLDTLFLTMPIAWKGKVAQYAGRLHRLYDGKDEVQIYDYIDVHIPVLERMYHKRACGYAAIGYKIKTMEQNAQKTNVIYDRNSFLPAFCNDIYVAAKEIIIVSPFMRKNRLFQMVRELSKAILNGAVVTAYTRPPEDFKDNEHEAILQNTEYLKSANIRVIYKSGIHQKFAVIDQNIVWYGSVNFLSFGSNEESIMRLESYDIGGELLGVV